MSINVYRCKKNMVLLVVSCAVYDKPNHAEIADKCSVAVADEREANSFSGSQSSCNGQVNDGL